MIKENQRLFNHLNVLSDAACIFLSLLVAFWIRFYVLPGKISLPFTYYLYLDVVLVPLYLLTFAAFGLYESFRKKRLYKELSRMVWACLLDLILIMVVLFISKEIHFSRGALIIFFILSTGGLGAKRVILRFALRYARQQGYNQKHVILIGDSTMAQQYYQAIQRDRELGYHVAGYIANQAAWKDGP